MIDAKLIKDIKNLVQQKKAVLLVHNYQLPEVQDIADFVGDSLELSIKASQTQAEIIVFCGVHFMAETAAILCPGKKVLLPDINAGCPMADMITVEQLQEMKKKHPQAKVVCYVNSSAAVKAESDICCTSANAVKIVNSITDTDEILFIPDKYLGSYVKSIIKNKKIILWEGYCPTHARILKEHINQWKEKHPQAKVMVHPECRPEVVAIADAVRSTSGMLQYAKETESKEIIVGTEIGLIYRLQKENPDKVFYPASPQAICSNMKLINLEKILWSLEEMTNLVTVPQEISDKAKKAIDKMIVLSKQD